MTDPAPRLPDAKHGTRLPALDGLRGLAVLIVLLSHSGKNGLLFFPWLNFDGAGRYGVFLFFVLSAYLLTSICLNTPAARLWSCKLWTEYFVRRFLRIYPLYAIALLVFWHEYYWGYLFYPHDGHEVLVALSLWRVDDIFWTIGVEFKYYLLLPVVVATIVLLRRSVWLTGIFFLVAAIVTRHFFPPEYNSELWPFLAFFLAGSFAAVLSPRVRGLELFWEIAGWIALGSILVLLPHLYGFLTRQDVPITRFHLRFGTWTAICTVLVLATLHGRGLLRRVFESGFLRFWGKISFSAYLGHMIVIARLNKMAPHWHPAARAAAFFVIVAAAAWGSYRLIERPLVKLGRRA